MEVFYFACVKIRQSKDTDMKQWFSAHILSREDFFSADHNTVSDGEFYGTLSLIGGALVLFTVLMHLFGG